MSPKVGVLILDQGQNFNIVLMKMMFKNLPFYFYWHLMETGCIFKKIIKVSTKTVNFVIPIVGFLLQGWVKMVI